MNPAASLLTMAFIVALGADEGVKSPVSAHAKEGKSVYVPVSPPINLFEEAHLQERDQNGTRHGAQQ